ncbi:MAG: DUF86 domain-containing protein [Bacteroidetes bacterium]|nr:DUF86 domain-containing protein [Bacteroidota bacterium]
MKTDEVYLHHILDAIVLIEQYTKEIVDTMFLEDTMRQDAVARQLEVIGEASRQLSESLRDDHSDIPWQAIIALRNRIAHDYLSIDVRVIWEVLYDDLPVLRRKVEAILE